MSSDVTRAVHVYIVFITLMLFQLGGSPDLRGLEKLINPYIVLIALTLWKGIAQSNASL